MSNQPLARFVRFVRGSDAEPAKKQAPAPPPAEDQLPDPFSEVEIPSAPTIVETERASAEEHVDLSAISPRSNSAKEHSEVPDDAGLQELAPALLKGVRAVLVATPPSFPWFATQVVEAASNPETDAAELARLVSSDAMIASQVLRVANTATFARGMRFVGLREAIMRLGMKEVAQIALIASTQALTNAASKEAFAEYPTLWRELWVHSISVSFSSSRLAADVGSCVESAAFLGGLLHDIGKMMGLQGLGLGIRVQRLPKLTEPEAARLMDLTHVQIGVDVAETCKYPEAVSTICREHHATTFPPGPNRRELAVVTLASSINRVIAGTKLDETDRASATAATRFLKLNQSFLRTFAAYVKDSRERAKQIMTFSG
jgi:putative nucleotidyltransferase with HDIG domain